MGEVYFATMHTNFHGKSFQKFFPTGLLTSPLVRQQSKDVERDNSQTGLPGQQPPPRAT